VQFQQLTEDRILDAPTLLAASRWSGAYYIAGYAVECALKSCVISFLAKNAGVIFEENKKKYSLECWTHNLDSLVELAGLAQARSDAIQRNQDLGRNWLTAKDWNEASRYQQKGEPDAKRLFNAINDQPNGVLQWIRNYW